jgi:tetratricopeptide (TPR) repeat protein
VNFIELLSATVSLLTQSLPENASADTSVHRLDEDLHMSALAKATAGDYRGAIEDYTQVLLSEPNNTEAYLNRGNARAALENYKGAIEDYTQVLRINPQDTRAYVNRSNVRRELGDYHGAIEDSHQARRFGFKEADGYVSRGLEPIEKDRQSFEQVQLINPDDIAAKHNRKLTRAKVGFQQGNLGEALENLFKG